MALKKQNRNVILSLTMLFFSFGAQAQSKCKISNGQYTETVYVEVDESPSYIGGIQAMGKFISKKFDFSKNEPFQASFHITCVIEPDGAVSHVRIGNKSTKKYSNADLEMIRVFTHMPKWEPGKCNGKKVACIVQVPFLF